MALSKDSEKINAGREEVREERRGDVGRIIFDARGPNLLTLTAFEGISRILDKYETDSSIKALELAGANGNFCGGVYLGWMSELQKSPKAAREAVDFLWETGLRIGQFPKPTFALIEKGACGGVGFELMTQCDYVAAWKKNESNIVFGALAPEYAFMLALGVNWNLPHKIGVLESARFLTKMGTTDLRETYRLGIVDVILDGDDFIQEVSGFEERVFNGEIQKKTASPSLPKIAGLEMEEIKRLASGCSPHVIERIIAAVETCSREPTLAKAMEIEKDFFLELFLSDEAKERISARIEKRTPKIFNPIIASGA